MIHKRENSCWKNYWHITGSFFLFAFWVLCWYCVTLAFNPKPHNITLLQKTAIEHKPIERKNRVLQGETENLNGQKNVLQNAEITSSTKENTKDEEVYLTDAKIDGIESLKITYDLFNSHFLQLLTVLGILVSIFGFALPLISYALQRQSLKDERYSIDQELERRLQEFRSTLTGELKKASQELQSETNTLIAGATQKLQETENSISRLKTDIEAKTTENISQVQQEANNANREVLKLHTQMTDMQTATERKIDLKLSEVKSETEKYTEQLTENKKEINNTFAFFAEQIGVITQMTNPSLACAYFLLAAERYTMNTSSHLALTRLLGYAKACVDNSNFILIKVNPDYLKERITQLEELLKDNSIMGKELAQIKDLLRTKGLIF